MEQRTVWIIGTEPETICTALMSMPDLRVSRFGVVSEAPGAGLASENRPALIVLDARKEADGVKQGVELALAIGAPLLVLVSDYGAAERALLLRADDVVVAPWRPEELRLRARKLLGTSASAVLRAGRLVISLDTREVRRWQQNIPLTSLEFDLLDYLVRSAGGAVTYDELLDNVWGYEHEGGTRELVRNAIKRLRRKLGDSVIRPRYVGTVRGVGYRWLSPPASAPRPE